MAGVPFHSVDGYLARLVRKGRIGRDLRADRRSLQVKGPVERQVVRVLTPGTVTDEALLDERRDIAASPQCCEMESVSGSRGWILRADDSLSWRARAQMHSKVRSNA